MHANYLDTLDWGILIAYFLILIGIGIWASLKRKKGSSLFLAERSLKWHHIGFSMWGTNVGPSMLIASASAGFTVSIRPRACFSPSYNKVKSQTKHVWLLTLL